MKFIRRNLVAALILLLVLTVWVHFVYAAFVLTTGVEIAYPNLGQTIKGLVLLRADAILTNSYVETDFTSMREYKSICLLFELDQGSLTSFEYKVWVSHDGVTWYQEATESVVSGVITDAESYYTLTFAADVDYFKVIPFYATYLKLEVKGTGAVTGSSCSVGVMGVY